MLGAAEAGLGIALLPTFTVHLQLASGALQVIDIGANADGAEIFVAYLADRSKSAKVQALTKRLRSAFGDPSYWDTPALAAKERVA